MKNGKVVIIGGKKTGMELLHLLRATVNVQLLVMDRQTNYGDRDMFERERSSW